MANRNFLTNKLYQFEAYPVLLSCKFTVDSTNAAGITSLKGGGIKNVFMHTSTTPASGSPNPAAGLIQVQLQDNYARLLGLMPSIHAPTTGSNLSVRASDAALTVGKQYVITVLGTTTTAANWITLGVPTGVTPAVGVAFVAAATGAGTGTVAKVKLAGVSSIATIESVGDSSLQNPAPSSGNQGTYLQLQCLAPTVSTGAFVTPYIPTAPADGSIIRLSFYLSNSSVLVQGQ